MLDLFSALLGMSMIGDAFDDDASRKNALRDDDPYHARDFSNEYDFFDEHMDDFDSFEDAQDYFDEHR